ncbi:Phospholipase YtpA [Roseovarius litorisediminis]|uniref:Phospholipase YtpA n=1 Tax=Roseovarius litorisediminis TaxID=1312363 RepID=A0A1Y5S9X5_9RHOB|nr:alpha/beta hydrolase [Roseovarius litorisediminis]SLN34303.1 Phospholipase YtpA [Roseovarius litorisediminis]
MKEAPLFTDVADGPDDGQAFWLTADDGVGLRVGLWNREAEKGTVLLFPGRTEYIEKYGRTAVNLAACGYATLAIDWRGQGLADRLLGDIMSGHVHHFTDYQRDVAAMIKAARQLDLPKPWHLLAHSMGGCIGLRSLVQGLPVESCAFSGPMWGIQMADALRPLAWSLSWSSRRLGMGHVYAPGTVSNSYVLVEPFERNKLTTDRDMYKYMIDQVQAHPELGLGGPSLRWLHEALVETRALAQVPSPSVPCFIVAGSDEEIVDMYRIRDRAARWPGARLEIIAGGRHEVLMDNPEIRKRVMRDFCQFFGDAAKTNKNARINPVSHSVAGGQAPQSQAS